MRYTVLPYLSFHAGGTFHTWEQGRNPRESPVVCWLEVTEIRVWRGLRGWNLWGSVSERGSYIYKERWEARRSLLNTKMHMSRVEFHKPGRKWLGSYKLNNSQSSHRTGSQPSSLSPGRGESPRWWLRAFSGEPSGPGLHNKVKECLEQRPLKS